MSQANFQKRLREKARQEKAAAKRQKREAGPAEVSDTAPVALSTDDQAKVLADLAALHEQYAAEQIIFDDFEDRKQELLGQLQV